MNFKDWLTIVNEAESTAEKDDKAEKAAKKVAKDIEYDEGHKGKDDDKAERAGKKVKKDMEYDMKKKKSLKDWFDHIDANYLKEGSIAPGQKPLPVLNPQNKTAGAGFVTSSNPAVQNMIKNLDPKDVQIVQTTGSTGNTPNTSNTSNTPNTSNTNATQNPMSEEQVDEKWAGGADVKHTGQYSGKSVAELKSMLAKLKKSGPHHKDSKEAKRMRQINFALRAKGGWKKGEGAAMKEGAKVDRMVKHIAKSERDAGKSKKDAENIAWATVNKRGMLDNKNKKKVKEADIPSTQGIDVNGAGLGAGRSQTTLEAMSPIANDGDSRGARLGVGRSKTTLEDYKLPNGVKVVQPETHKMPKAPKGSAPRNPLDDLEKKSLGQKVKSLFTKKGIEEAETLQQAGVDGTSRGGLGMGRSTTTLESRTKAFKCCCEIGRAHV